MLVAGGLGERLGYSGIKLALPVDSARGACFLQVLRNSLFFGLDSHSRILPISSSLLPFLFVFTLGHLRGVHTASR